MTIPIQEKQFLLNSGNNHKTYMKSFHRFKEDIDTRRLEIANQARDESQERKKEQLEKEREKREEERLEKMKDEIKDEVKDELRKGI
jgi:Skp family chaperone for outer membrane proteins